MTNETSRFGRVNTFCFLINLLGLVTMCSFCVANRSRAATFDKIFSCMNVISFAALMIDVWLACVRYSHGGKVCSGAFID